MKKILVAIDGSKTAEKVLQKSLSLATEFNADTTVMTVVKHRVPSFHYRLGTDFGGSQLEDKESQEIADRMIAHAKEVFKDYTGHFETLVEKGDPSEEILLASERIEPDLLIVGSRGLGAFDRITLGSVSTRVLHHASCDVMIIRS